ncbi:hypothetical protein D3C76_1782630 [compost metagenome]
MSNKLSRATPRQKLSCRLIFHSALASANCSSAICKNALLCAVLLHRLPPKPIRAKAATCNP